MKTAFRVWMRGGIVALGAVLLLPGCASIRIAREAQRGDSFLPGERTTTAIAVGLPPQYAPGLTAGLASNTVLSLDRALDVAFSSHSSITIASQQVVVAEARYGQAKSAFWPNLNASAGYSKSSSGDNDGSWSAGLQLQLLVYDFGKTPAAARQAALNRVVAAENLRGARNDLAYSVRSAYLALCKTRELQGVAENAVSQYEKHAAQVATYAEVGSKTRYDLIKAQLDLANARMDLISASNSVSDARAQLNSLLGLAEDPAYDVVTSPPGDYKPDFTNLVAKAGRDHPDMRKLQAQALIASAEVDSAIADLFPDIGLSGRYSGSGADFPLTWNWSAGVDAALSLFTGWRKTAAIDIAVAELRIARASVAGKEQGLYLELRRAMNQLMAARRKLDLAGMAARQARENSELLQERYKVGSATAVELTDAQVSLTRAMSAQVNARFDYEAAWAQMLHLTGEER